MDTVIESSVVGALATATGSQIATGSWSATSAGTVWCRIAHVMAAMNAGRTVTYDRVAALRGGRLVGAPGVGPLRARPPARHPRWPALCRPRPAGGRWSPGRRRPLAALRLDRTAARQAPRPASASSPSARSSWPSRSPNARSPAPRSANAPTVGARLHRPDLAVLAEAGAIAIEVELTPKAPRRL